SESTRRGGGCQERSRRTTPRRRANREERTEKSEPRRASRKERAEKSEPKRASREERKEGTRCHVKTTPDALDALSVGHGRERSSQGAAGRPGVSSASDRTREEFSAPCATGAARATREGSALSELEHR